MLGVDSPDHGVPKVSHSASSNFAQSPRQALPCIWRKWSVSVRRAVPLALASLWCEFRNAQFAEKGTTWPENVAVEQSRMLCSAIGKQIAAKQCPGGALHNQARLRCWELVC